MTSSGEEAIKLVENTRPNFVLMDIKLRDEMSGIQVADIIKEKYSIPSIYFTALSDEGTLDMIKQSGNQEYVLKPLVEDELKEVIQRLFDLNETERCE
jgi:CheY-like chemotaxis protein